MSKKETIAPNVAVNYHKLSVDELCQTLSTSASEGLVPEKARALLLKYGPNVLPKPKSRLFQKIFQYLFTGFCILLWIGSLICFLAYKPLGGKNPDVSNLYLAILLLFVIFLQASFEAFMDWSSSQVMLSIKNLMPSDATVVRGGVEMKVSVADLVVGDLVLLTYGAKVPADLRLIESQVTKQQLT